MLLWRFTLTIIAGDTGYGGGGIAQPGRGVVEAERENVRLPSRGPEKIGSRALWLPEMRKIRIRSVRRVHGTTKLMRSALHHRYKNMQTSVDPYELLARKRQEILALAQRRGATNIRIFGSVSRHEARPDSDIDLLIDLEPGRSLLDAGGLAMDLQMLLGHPVDIVTEAGLRPRIRAGVLKDARPL